MTDSPVKKLSFGIAADKENHIMDNSNASITTIDAGCDADPKLIKPSAAIKTEEKKAEPQPAVAPTSRPEEADEPLLQENPHRFVLFPIKYHEVSPLCFFPHKMRRTTRLDASKIACLTLPLLFELKKECQLLTRDIGGD
jgi:hypothetical protein